MKRATLQRIIDTLFHSWADIEFLGTENLPPQGGLIIATNHLSRFDIPLLFINPVRKDLTALVTDKYRSNLFFNWFSQTAEAIWLDRTKADFTAFRIASDVLRQGLALGIAPEGTRSASGLLQEAKAGTALLAFRTQTPIVPVAIAGTEKIAHAWPRLQKPHIVAQFGKPIVLPPLELDNRDAQLQAASDEIMCQIAAMLPEAYRGFYTHHPRLLTLLETKNEH